VDGDGPQRRILSEEYLVLLKGPLEPVNAKGQDDKRTPNWRAPQRVQDYVNLPVFSATVVCRRKATSPAPDVRHRKAPCSPKNSSLRFCTQRDRRCTTGSVTHGGDMEVIALVIVFEVDAFDVEVRSGLPWTTLRHGPGRERVLKVYLADPHRSSSDLGDDHVTFSRSVPES
jgi:hypothetical protein